MGQNLNCAGLLWSVTSVVAAFATSIGYYMPYWLVDGLLTDGHNVTAASMGTFRRCGYLRLVSSTLTISSECGRYQNFQEIPDLWLKVATISVGVGAALSLLIAFVTSIGCCLSDVISRTTARVLGMFQVIAGIVNGVGLVMYPLGWGSPQVKEVCGNTAGAYLLGNCSLGWAFWAVTGGTGLLLLCGSLSTRAGKPVEWQRLKQQKKVSQTGVSTTPHSLTVAS